MKCSPIFPNEVCVDKSPTVSLGICFYVSYTFILHILLYALMSSDLTHCAFGLRSRSLMLYLLRLYVQSYAELKF